MHTLDEDYITEMIKPELSETSEIMPAVPTKVEAPKVEQINIEIVIKKNKINSILSVLNPLNIVGSTFILYGFGGLYKYKYSYSNYSTIQGDVYFGVFMLFGAMIMGV